MKLTADTPGTSLAMPRRRPVVSLYSLAAGRVSRLLAGLVVAGEEELLTDLCSTLAAISALSSIAQQTFASLASVSLDNKVSCGLLPLKHPKRTLLQMWVFALSRLLEREQAVVRVEADWGGEQALLSCLPELHRLSHLDIAGYYLRCGVGLQSLSALVKRSLHTLLE